MSRNPDRDWGRPSWPSKPQKKPGGGHKDGDGCLYVVAVVVAALLLVVATCW